MPGCVTVAYTTLDGRKRVEASVNSGAQLTDALVDGLIDAAVCG
ncbi:hypothetical protein [Saccharothrix australiensis]|nr:hypothetical protein [Saccharothrix australiensis]